MTTTDIPDTDLNYTDGLTCVGQTGTECVWPEYTEQLDLMD